MFAIIRICWLLSTVALMAFAEDWDDDEPGNDNIIGNEAKLEDYPFLVRLRVIQDIYGQERKWPCGGSLVRPDWVITAAFCLLAGHQTSPSVANTAVIAKMSLQNGDPDPQNEGGTAPIPSITVVIHPQLTELDDDFVNNIGLVQLERAFDLSPLQSPIEMAVSPLNYNQEVTMAGYSTFTWLKHMNTSALPPGYMNLRSLTVPLWPQNKCDTATSATGLICIGAPKGIIWGYDIGGPLIGEGRLIGITSIFWRNRYEFGVFENIYTHKQWLEDVMNGTMKGRKARSGVQRSRAFSVIYLLFVVCCMCVVYLIKAM